jgi:acetyl esterase/lipase
LNTSIQKTFDAAVYEKVPAGRGPSLQARLVRAQMRWLVRPWMNPHTPLRLQRLLTGLMKWTLPQARGVATQRLPWGERHYDLHAPSSLPGDGGAIVHFHGGGYTVCSPDTHRSMTQRMAKEAAMAVYVPQYRLAPEHAYPAQLDDAQAFVTMLERHGMDVRSMVFSGDSAGAHLALTLAIQRRDLGLPLPRALVLMSPCVDWTLDGLPARCQDALLTLGWVAWSRNGYVAPDVRSTPWVSPIRASLHGLPPTLIQSSSVELFAPHAQQLYARLVGAGVQVTWQEWPGLWHDFQLYAALVPEGQDAVRRCARFVRAGWPLL